MQLKKLLDKDDFNVSLFNDEEIGFLERQITHKDIRGRMVPHINCLIREKEIRLTPEEVIRQLFVKRLLTIYKYPKDRIQLEYPVQFGADSSKRADIVVFDKERPTIIYILVELKKPKAKEGKDQLKSYCNATGSPLGVWTNGAEIEFFHRKEPNIFDRIDNIPSVSETLKDVLNQRFTILDLLLNDELEKKTLKQVIEEFEDEVLANAGVDVFEEAFKLIFTKLFDEYLSGEDKDRIQYWLEENDDKALADIPEKTKKKFRNLEFRNTGVEADTKKQIDELFEEAKKEWKGIFIEGSKIELTPSHLQTCVSYLQNVKLFNSNLEVVDEAFEYLVNKDSKGEKGQYFTPRYIIDLCVKMLDPKPEEFMIDTAAGSCGFPVHTIFHVWKQLNPDSQNLFTTAQKTKEQIKYVKDKVFAIDFDPRTVRVARTLNLIAGDGESNVLHLNSLDFERWEADNLPNQNWMNNYLAGFNRLKNLRRDKKNESYKEFQFDILMANPPFAGDIRDTRLIRRYELAKKASDIENSISNKLSKDKGWHEKISRDILFIERNLDMLKDGGRMAIVLPQGRFNNTTDQYIREYVKERCRVLAVIGLHINSFKPHTGAKTSVLFVQKWHPELCPKISNYKVFFGIQQLEGKNNSGEKLYWSNIIDKTTTKPEEALRDEFNHPIVYHDLFSTKTSNRKYSATPEGIFEAFYEFGKREKLSWISGKFDEKKYKSFLDRLNIAERDIQNLGRANRLDSEFYDAAIQKEIEFLSKDGLTIGDIAELQTRRFKPSEYPNSTFNYIEIGDILNDGRVNSSIINVEEAPSRATWIVQNGDVITSTVRPIRRLTAIIDEEQDGFVCSSGFAVLKAKNVSPEILFSFLRNPTIVKILDLYTTASMYPAISIEDLLSIPFKMPSNEVMKLVTKRLKRAKEIRREYYNEVEMALEELAKEIIKK